jgi:hypothetical protein
MPSSFYLCNHMRHWLFICALLSLSTQVHAQYELDEDIRVFSGGPIIGGNFAQVDGDDCYGYYKIGLNAGGIVNIQLAQKVAVSMELLYTQKGARCTRKMTSPFYGDYFSKYYLSLNYVEMPVTIRYRLSHWRRLELEAGGSFAYLLHSSEEVISDIPVWIDPEINRMNKTDVNLIAGLKALVYKRLYANFRFQYSVLSVRPMERIPAGYGYGNQGQFNNVVSLRFMYLF